MIKSVASVSQGFRLLWELVPAGRLTVRQIWTVTLWEGPVEAKGRSSTSLRAESRVSKTPVSKQVT
ncbi:hypothetical protein [Levilactobacillus yiduensis]|uniref:hypothetical protein n=1 Tax=Levilactobacillus yiduensis TaxID=2953880 RepID=UPI0021571BA4|nr:hypothetical protein [Levilactobacillus yiduensis]